MPSIEFINDYKYQKKTYSAVDIEAVKAKLIASKDSKELIKLTELEMKMVLSDVIENTYLYLLEDPNLSLSFRNTCDKVEAISGYLLEELGVKIFLGDTHKSISKDVIGHNFLIAELYDVKGDKQLFLLDLSFRQFLLKESLVNQKMAFNGLIVKGNEPGYYLASKTEGMYFIKTMIEDGYTKLDSSSAKLFGDSFYEGKTGIELPNELGSNISGNSYLKFFQTQLGDYSIEYEKYKNNLEKEGLKK